MPRTKKVAKKRSVPSYKLSSHSPILGKSSQSFIDKISSEVNSNQSYLNLILGLLIILVAGVLVFNYLKKSEPSLGPAQETTAEETQKDVKPEDLPGKYTVKTGDTLFRIAEAYYKDGWKFAQIAAVNKLVNADIIGVGQILEIPKVEEEKAELAGSTGTGGATNSTIWGDKIEGDTYTVEEGDWLSKIAGRAYGDILAFDKIAKANNITNPDIIEPGTILKIPR
ncbi:MAG: LysM domain-containing protein [bacterium]|nr:LysM domain-containing protein [bacterium]